MAKRLSSGLIMSMNFPKNKLLAVGHSFDHVKVFLKDKYGIDPDCYLMHETDDHWCWTPKREWIEEELFSFLARYYAAMYPIELSLCQRLLEFVDGAEYMQIVDFLNKGGHSYFSNDYEASPIRYGFFTNKLLYHIEIHVNWVLRLGIDGRSQVPKSDYILPFANRCIVSKYEQYKISGMHYTYESG